jgi:hypothetical protein
LFKAAIGYGSWGAFRFFCGPVERFGLHLVARQRLASYLAVQSHPLTLHLRTLFVSGLIHSSVAAFSSHSLRDKPLGGWCLVEMKFA